MKVVFYNHTGKVSGAEKVLLAILSRLDAAEFHRVVLCPAEGPLAEMVSETGTPVEIIADLNARFTVRPDKLLGYGISCFRVIADLRRKFVSLNTDVIHANSIRAGIIATVATARLKTTVVWHLHDLLPRHPLSSLIRSLAAVSQRSRMIAVSDSVRRNFCGRVSALLGKRVTTILNGIDLSSFAPSGPDRRTIRKSLSLNTDDFVVGTVGQLTPRKGQLELLAAFAEFAKLNSRAMLLIVGGALFNRDYEYESRLRETAEQLGIADRVQMLGNRNDVRDIMRVLDVLVINSRREPFGLVACEAMACATPVIASATDGLAEIVEHQKNGLLVSFGDQAQLVGAMTLLSQDAGLRNHLIETAREDVARRFSIERYIHELEAFYRQSCDEKFVARETVPASGQTQQGSLREVLP